MQTRLLVVQPLFSVIVDESGNAGIAAPVCQSAGPVVGEKVAANGAILAALAALFQKAVTELPVILPEILQLISLFGGTAPSPAPAATT